MKKLALFLLPLCFFAGCSTSKTEIDTTVDMTPRLISTSQTLSTEQIAETVKSAIVGISAKVSGGSSIGSGVAIADGGYIITNFHVISGFKNITVYFADKSTSKAEFVWGDSGMDLALIRSSQNLPHLDTAPLENVTVGEDVLAVGTPLSLNFQHTFTKGIVSALNRTIEIESLGGYTTYMQNLIQHDASINSGNSGGPLINAQGKVIGINSLKASDAEGIGFAIPIETATAVTQKFIPNGEYEQVHLGVFAVDGDSLGIDNGVVVVDVEKNTALFNSGLQAGDVITEINNKEIKNMLDLRKAIISLNRGDNVEITVFTISGQRTISLKV